MRLELLCCRGVGAPLEASDGADWIEPISKQCVMFGGNTALGAAAARGQVEAASLLLSRRARVDAVNSGGQSPLHLACKAGCAPMVRLLLNHRASVRLEALDGNTPLHCACMGRVGSSAVSVASLLLDSGCDVNVWNTNGSSPYGHAMLGSNNGAPLDLLRSQGGEL